MKIPCAVVLAVGFFGLTASAAEPSLRIPSATAYVEPDGGARVSSRSGITGWTNPATRIVWFGRLAPAGSLDAAVELRLPADAESKLRLSVGDKSQTTVVRGAGTNAVTAAFGRFDISGTAYRKFILESLNPAGRPFGEIDALVLKGSALTDAHF